MSDANPQERADLEGMPDEVQDLPPGKDIETSEEATMLPREHSVAAGSDPAYPVTAAEQGQLESAGARRAREQPEVALADEAPADQLVDDPDGPTAASGSRAASPEEAAIHIVEEP